MFRYLILVTPFFILFFTVLCIYGDHIHRQIYVTFEYTKVSDGDFWDITVNFDGRTKTYSKRKDSGLSGFPVYFDDGGYYLINTSGTGDVYAVRRLEPIDHEHDQPTVPRSTPIRAPESSPDASSDPSPVSTAPVNITPGRGNAPTKAVAAPAPTKVTEYMLQDWGGSGWGRLPQWIELYNPNATPVSLKGWTLESGGRSIPITGLVIPAQQVSLIVTQRVASRDMSGIGYDRIFIFPRDMANLKKGWILTDSTGNPVSRVLNPTLPPRKDGYRVSHQQYPSESPTEDYFYGNQNDVGSPGFYIASSTSGTKFTTSKARDNLGTPQERKIIGDLQSSCRSRSCACRFLYLKIRAILFTEPKHLVSKFLHRTVRKLDNHLCRDLLGQTRVLRRIPQHPALDPRECGRGLYPRFPRSFLKFDSDNDCSAYEHQMVLPRTSMCDPSTMDTT